MKNVFSYCLVAFLDLIENRAYVITVVYATES